MPKVSQQYRDDRRGQILQAAQRCFLRDGFHATSMQDLFAEAGLSSGAVYRYFASKDEMIVAIAHDNMQEVMAMIHAVAAQRSSASVGETIAGVLDLVAGKHAKDGLGGLAIQVWSEALRNPTLATELSGLIRRTRADLVAVVRHHQASGALHADVSADAVAALLFSVVPGYILQLALLGPAAVKGVPKAARALWPAAQSV